MKERLRIVTNGLLKENPSLRLVLGTCPTLAVTTVATNGLGMGLGFTLTLLVMGSVRELLGAGTLFNVPVMDMLFEALHLPFTFQPMTLFIMPPGGFLVFGVLMALVVALETKMGARITRRAGCEGCPAAAACGGACEGAQDARKEGA